MINEVISHLQLGLPPPFMGIPHTLIAPTSHQEVRVTMLMPVAGLSIRSQIIRESFCITLEVSLCRYFMIY